MANQYKNSTTEIAETASQLCAGRHAKDLHRPDASACNQMLELAYTHAECRQTIKGRS